ncbi:Csu type fimbrial protein [Rickettsiella endosymbiont of Dermanyssus gallinae]|uniref:Csu type fimbrial protein n=1 Tax=Rickettsiella endosymbiont of Dermanyssus gallinae TaxID=2856608 RepID=UPI001C53423E|nr:spore coat U domain-containing protein [Rickettsiella endosymbiont of Dermanyssus gallinae]
MLYLVRILAGLFLVFICQSAVSATATGALAVTANVGGAENCVLGMVNNMVFPNYSPFDGKPDDATGSLTVNCIANLPYDVGINKGQGNGATEDQRKATILGGSQELNYNLFQDANHVHKYGTIIGQNTLHQLGTGVPQLITIYGEIAMNQAVEVGPYSDRVTIFVTF